MPLEEYAAYAPRIAGRLDAGAPPHEIALELGRTRTEAIGLHEDPCQHEVAAAKVAAWYEATPRT